MKDYNATKTRRVLIVSDDVIEGEEKSIFQLFSSHNLIPKCLKANVRHYFIMKIPNKRELQWITSHHLSDIYFKEFMKLHKDYTTEQC